MKRSFKNKIALFSAGVLGAGALFGLAGCGAVKIGVGETTADGETTVIVNPTKTVTEYTAEENAYILAGKLKSLDSYRSDVQGKVVAMGGLYKQSIADVHIKNGNESYMEARSSSSLVTVEKQAFFAGDKVVMRDAEQGDFTVTTLEEYRSKIGSEPTALSNYILNEETITSAELVSRSEGTYTYRYEIDPVKGTSRYAVKMMNFGGLKVAPEFESCAMELTFDENWNPVSLKAEDKYKISKAFLNNVSCTSTLTETFSEIGKGTEIPDADSFRARLGDDVTNIVPDDDGERDALTSVADALLNMDLSGGIKLCGELTATGRSGRLFSLPVDGWLSFDIERLASDGLSSAFRGRVSTEIVGLETEFLYPGDGMLYVRLGDAAYKYALPASEEGTELDDLLRLFELSAEGNVGNTYAYRLTLGGDLLAPANEAIGLLTESLPDGSPLKELAINEVGALISIHRQSEKDAGRITGVSLNGDFGIASLTAQVVASEISESLPSGEELAKYEAVNAEDISAVLSSVLKLAGNLVDFDVNIRGELTLEAGADRLLSLPVNGWLSLDAEKLMTAGVSGVFSGGLSTELLGIPVEFFYAGDGCLYVRVSGSKYKYSLSSLQGSMDLASLSDISDILELSVTNGSADMQDYKLSVREEVLGAINEVLGSLTASLPADSPLKGFSAKELSASFSVYKKGNGPARLAGARLVADLGVASLNAEVVVQAGAESLPSVEELAKYEEAELSKLSSNLGALLKMAAGIADFDWSAGMNFTLNVGLDSDTNGNFMLIPLPVRLQVLPEELSAGNVWGCFRMNVSLTELGLSMFGLPDEIYYENGTLYIVGTTKADGTTYGSSVSAVDVKGALAGLAADNLGVALKGVFGGSDTDIIAFLADAVMSAQLEVSSLEDGTLRYQLNAGDKLAALLGAGYGAIWDALNAADIPSIEDLKPLLMMFFDFDIDRVCLRADFKDGALNALSVRLTNDGTAIFGSGADFSFVLGMTMDGTTAAGEMDEAFAFLSSTLVAYEEGAPVREKIAALAANGVQWLGDSYGAVLDEAEAAYNALSAAGKATVTNYSRLAALRTEWEKLRAPVSRLSALLDELKLYDGAEGAEASLGALLEQSDPIFEALDDRQKEYFGDYAAKEYLAIRTKYEKNTVVPALKAEIDALNGETYGTAAELAAAIDAVQAKYDGLHETSKALVDNYEKIEEARAVQKEMAEEEQNT